jgi:hypothetical protein
MKPLRIADLIDSAMAPKKSEKSKLEDSYLFQLRARQMPEPRRQHRFAADAPGRRRWRFDFDWEPYMLAVEIDGIVVQEVNGRRMITGGHGTVAQFSKDMDKGNAAILFGWSVLHFGRDHIRSGIALDVTYRVLVARGWTP